MLDMILMCVVLPAAWGIIIGVIVSDKVFHFPFYD